MTGAFSCPSRGSRSGRQGALRAHANFKIFSNSKTFQIRTFAIFRGAMRPSFAFCIFRPTKGLWGNAGCPPAKKTRGPRVPNFGIGRKHTSNNEHTRKSPGIFPRTQMVLKKKN